MEVFFSIALLAGIMLLMGKGGCCGGLRNNGADSQQETKSCCSGKTQPDKQS